MYSETLLIKTYLKKISPVFPDKLSCPTLMEQMKRKQCLIGCGNLSVHTLSLLTPLQSEMRMGDGHIPPNSLTYPSWSSPGEEFFMCNTTLNRSHIKSFFALRQQSDPCTNCVLSSLQFERTCAILLRFPALSEKNVIIMFILHTHWAFGIFLDRPVVESHFNAGFPLESV